MHLYLHSRRVPVLLTIIFIADFLFRLALHWHNRKGFLTGFSALIDYLTIASLFLQLPLVVVSTSMIARGTYLHEVAQHFPLLDPTINNLIILHSTKSLCRHKSLCRFYYLNISSYNTRLIQVHSGILSEEASEGNFLGIQVNWLLASYQVRP